MPSWKIFMIQFLNIAGLGPIFGAIMGAQFGTASYLWIVFGTIFAGAVHDFFSGTLSIRNSGESLPEIVGRFLGTRTKKVSMWTSPQGSPFSPPEINSLLTAAGLHSVSPWTPIP
jgi:carbon starvation protein CstA